MAKNDRYDMKLRIPRQLHDRLLQLAALESRSLNALITLALERYANEWRYDANGPAVEPRGRRDGEPSETETGEPSLPPEGA